MHGKEGACVAKGGMHGKELHIIIFLCEHNDQLKVFNLRLMELDYVITGFKANFC